MPMVTKLGRVVTCHEGFPSVKPYDPLITRSYKKPKTTISLLLQSLRRLNLAGS